MLVCNEILVSHKYMSCLLGFLYAKFYGELKQYHQHLVEIFKKGENEVSLSVRFCFDDVCLD
jgi:hypothetical protein